MGANLSREDTELVEAGIAWLRERLPPAWSVERSQRLLVARSHDAQKEQVDGAIDVRAPNGTFTTFAVEARGVFSPRDVSLLLPRLSRVLRTLSHNVPILVIAPWLSARTRELLAAERINFIDLTGNALVRLDNPALYLSSVGATRSPEPAARGRARARGAKAARLIRLLIDARPPYRVQDLATTAGLAPGYVSRLLETLDREALIERGPRGQVESVDVPGPPSPLGGVIRSLQDELARELRRSIRRGGRGAQRACGPGTHGPRWQVGHHRVVRRSAARADRGARVACRLLRGHRSGRTGSQPAAGGRGCQRRPSAAVRFRGVAGADDRRAGSTVRRAIAGGG